ncbi:MAG: energy transducer TonB, partial [Pseudomonadota bacterium]|nr:energy transducer TonB [Pseudomonadota bacterium]
AAPAAAPPAPVAGPRTITSGVEYIRAPQPDYPALSKRMGEQGKVVLRILVNEKGLPDQVTVQTSSGFARLDEAGRQAALRALFKPHMEDGRPVAVFVIVPLNFQMAS